MLLNHDDIRKILPHRYPMLLVDAITSMEKWERITGLKAVTGTEGCYKDIPDGSPREAYAYPLCLMMESFGQTGGVLINQKRVEENAPKDVVMLAAGCTSFKLIEEVYPGDTMEHRVILDKDMPDFAVIGGEIWVRGKMIAEIEAMIVAYRAPDVIAGGGKL
jgi:3-hydroxyacyl-[acyl-carrier-protein] dehydratase